MLNGHLLTQSLYVAARLRIADLLADQPMSADELAVRTGTHAPSLYRLLRTLASLGVFHEDGHGKFQPHAAGRVSEERSRGVAVGVGDDDRAGGISRLGRFAV